MHDRPTLQSHRRTVVVAMLCAWLLLQLLTVLHGIAHAPRPDTAHAGSAGVAWSSWFPHETGDSDCRALDQIGHADAVPAPVACPATFATVDRWLRQAAGPLLARQAAGFLARGPPIAG